MKFVAVILDGAVDEALPELENRSPLIAGTGEHLAALARGGRVGAVQPLPPDWTGDPEAALLALCGYSPREHFTGRGPLDAAALQIDLERADIAFRLHLVHTDGRVLVDPTAGGFPGSAGARIVRDLQERLGHRTIQFFPDSGFRHVMVWRSGPDGLQCSSPYDLQGVPLEGGMPFGDRAEELRSVLWDAAEILAEHEANRRRRGEGLPTADLPWPWSPGRQPRLQSFAFRHGIGGACVGGNPMVRGLARLTGLRAVVLPDSAGTPDTDYRLKARAVLSALEEEPFCLAHIEAPNEAGLAGDWEAKTDAIRRIDERFFGTLLDRIGRLDDFRILVVVDHATRVRERRPVPGWMPFLLSGTGMKPKTAGILPFDERAIDDAELRIDEGERLLEQLFRVGSE